MTLELFHKLVDLNCEDLMLELVIRLATCMYDYRLGESVYTYWFSSYSIFFSPLSLVFTPRHLLPGQHIMPNQLAIIGAPDLYSQAARKLLQLIPTSCINAEKMFLNSIRPVQQQNPLEVAPPPEVNRDGTPPLPPQLTSSPSSPPSHLERPIVVHGSAFSPFKPGSGPHSGTAHSVSSNPFDLPMSRSRSGSDTSTSSLVSMSSVSSTPQAGSHVTGMPTMSSTNAQSGSGGVPTHSSHMPPLSRRLSGREKEKRSDSGPNFEFDYLTPEMAYLNSLSAAREAIAECTSRCRCWSNEYNKCKVSKENFEAEETRTVGIGTKSLEMEDVPVRIRVTNEGGDDMDDKKQEEEDFSRFRNRSTTLSSHSRISRTSSVKVTSRQQRLERPSLEDRMVKNGNESSELANDSMDHLNSYSSSIRRRGTVSSSLRGSPRPSPRLGRKFANSPIQFEDKAGLFLKVLTEKLAEMLKHPPAVNVLLTQVICRLAHYPQPLIRSFLLNHQLVLRPGVPNLLYVSTCTHVHCK